MFSMQHLDLSSVEQCPMLIGIMRRSEGEKGWSITSDYEFKLLLTGDTLTRTSEKLTPETLLSELIIFKKKCDDNEQALVSLFVILHIFLINFSFQSFDFVTRTGLCWEIVLEIATYLTLNDAVNVFSDNILSLLCKHRTKLHLSNPSRIFTNMIRQKIEPEQIVSLRLNTILFSSWSELVPLDVFTNVISLTLLSFQGRHLTNTDIYERHFPKVIRLSLWYDNEVNFTWLNNILKQLYKPIKRLEIHCEGVLCTHHLTDTLNTGSDQILTVEYFLLDVRHASLPSMNECSKNHKSCFLMIIIYLMKKMLNIRHVHLITNKQNLEKLLDMNEWKSLVNVCHQLKKITVEVLGSISIKEQLSRKAIEIQKILHNDRQTVKFYIASK